MMQRMKALMLSVDRLARIKWFERTQSLQKGITSELKEIHILRSQIFWIDVWLASSLEIMRTQIAMKYADVFTAHGKFPMDQPLRPICDHCDSSPVTVCLHLQPSATHPRSLLVIFLLLNLLGFSLQFFASTAHAPSILTDHHYWSHTNNSRRPSPLF